MIYADRPRLEPGSLGLHGQRSTDGAIEPITHNLPSTCTAKQIIATNNSRHKHVKKDQKQSFFIQIFLCHFLAPLDKSSQCVMNIPETEGKLKELPVHVQLIEDAMFMYSRVNRTKEFLFENIEKICRRKINFQTTIFRWTKLD